ncbi:DNA-binding protein RFX2 isoform X2 [Acyrthosiphon pisum]|nr:DNA-binding protein RFX2 isoform X2 [Acyrthosiphon pisum]
MTTSVRTRIKLEGSVSAGPQVNTIPVVTADRVGQTLVIQPVQQSFVNVNSNRQLANATLCGTSTVHDDGSNKSTDNDEYHLDHKDRKFPTVTVDNDHYIVAKSEGTHGTYYTSLTPIPTLVPKVEPVDYDDVGHSTYVQYVEAIGEQAIFTNEEMVYPVYTVGEIGTMHQTDQTHYYTPSTNSFSQDVSYHTVNATESDVTNINQLNSVEESNRGMQNSGLIQANKISPATVDWLMDNYEKAEGVSLLRSTIYDNYLTHCSETKFDPLNAPSFGKLIRSVFTGLQTRRLGTRGNSKYHYYGIRIKPNSLLNELKEEESLPVETTSRSSSSKKIKKIKIEEQNCNQYTTISSDSGNYSQNSIPSSPSQAQDQEYLGDGANAVPQFPDIILDELQLDDNCTLEDVDTFKHLYREHYKAFLSAVLNLEFGTIESLWRQFWCSQDNKNDEYEVEQYLSKEKLYSLSKCKTLQLFVKTVDFLFYQNLVKVLIPDVLRPVPRTLTEAIRNFSKSLESWLISAMHGFPEEMISIKVAAVRAFAQTLRRCTSARAVLQNYTKINQILTDLNCMDFYNEQEYVQQINNLENDNDAVHTKKRVNSEINEGSEMLSDCNEPPKKPKTPNYSASTSTEPERFNVLLRSPSKETKKNKSKMAMEETKSSKDDMDEEKYYSNDCVGDDNENNFVFTTQDDYNSKYPTMIDPGRFSCRFCDREFTNANSLSRHENFHTGRAPLECDVCFKTFISKSILCIHKRSHTGVKPYACVICGRSFTQKSNLVLHYRRHTQVKNRTSAVRVKKSSHQPVVEQNIHLDVIHKTYHQT